MTINASPPAPPRSIPLKDAANFAQCCRRTLRKAIAQGHLRAYRVSSRIYVKPEDLQAYLTEREVAITPDELDTKASTHSGPQGEPSTTTTTASATPSKEEPHDRQ